MRFTFAPTSFQVAGQTFYQPAWQADSGVAYTLESTNAVLTKAGNSYFDLTTGQPYNPGNPFFSGPSYTLVAPDHTQYQLDSSGNIIGEITPSGAQLYISDSGITAANGQTIQFLRNSQGLITSIVAPGGQVVNYQYDANGNLVSMQNETTGGSQRYGYSLSDPHLLIAAVRSNGNSVEYTPGTTTTAYIQRDLGDAAEFSDTTINNTLAAGETDLFSFRLNQAELNSTATGSILLRVVVQGTDGVFVPATPTIAGLQPLSVNTRGTIVVALFQISQPGLYVVSVAGATASTTGKYSLNLTVAGDLNGDGNVDGNDSALFAAALGSALGGANFSLAVDINGDGKVDQEDEVILASDYGFTATTVTAPSTPPAQPVFNLDVSSDTPPVGDGMTSDATVTLVGETDPNVTVVLQPTGATTTSNPNGLFAFFGVPLSLGANSFTAVATNADNVSSQYTYIITRTQPGLSLIAPVISAKLANDTGPSALDNITSDDTVTGSITAVNPITSLQAQLDQSNVVNVLSSLSGTRFTITPALLAQINGGPVSDGKHTLTLLAKDSNGNLSQPVSVSFILITTPPAPVTPQLLAASDTGISSSDGITRDTTPTFKVVAPANDIVTLYANGVQVGQATAYNGPVFIATRTLSAGTYQMTATAEDLAGNVSTAAAPVTLVISTTPPNSPTLGLDAASQSPAGQTTETNLAVVNLTGTTSAGAFVALYRQWDPNTAIRTTQANGSGDFTFNNVALAAGSQAFIVVASDVAGNSSTLTQTITTTASDTSAPVITAALASDTGISNTDGITSDPTITGVVDDPSGVASFQVSVDGGAMTDATSFLTGEGFALTAADLATLNGGVTLPDGPHTISLQATDNLGYQSTVDKVSFTLDATRPLPPSNLHLMAGDDTGPNQLDGYTMHRSFTVELSAPAGTMVTLYMQGNQIGEATAPTSGALAFPVVGPLPDGQYLFTAIASTVSGLSSPFSVPYTVTVDDTPPPIESFVLDPGSQTRPYGQNLTVFQTVTLDGQTKPGSLVTLLQTQAQTTADSSGNFSFYPVNLPNLGAFTFTVQVTDIAGNVNTQSITVTRVDDTLSTNLLPPDVTLNVSKTTAPLGDTVNISAVVATHDGQPVANEVLLINGNQVALSSGGTATLSSVTPGVFTVVLKAFDMEGNEGDDTQTVTFLAPPSGEAPPVAGFNETVVTPVVTLPTAITGTANSTNFLQYTLQDSPEGKDEWTTMASGTTPVVNGTLGTIDPTLMVNGFYDVRLTVEDTSGQVTTADEIYDVEGAAKLGNFTLTYQDEDVPLPGVTLTATREYDSRLKNVSGDFGYGWTLQTTQASVTASSVLGAGFIETETQLPATQVDPLGGLGSLLGGGGLGGLLGGLPGVGLPPGLGSRPAEIQYSFQNTQNDYVDVTLPDGTVEKFIMGFTGVTYNFAAPPLATTSIFFVPLPGSGTTGTLVALTNNNVVVSPAQVGPVTFIDQSTGQVYNPTKFQYTGADGTVYVISTTDGLESITSSTGSGEDVSAGAETSTTGASLTITRDSQGRVTSITDPMGNTTTYTYDFYGDLVAVTDPEGNVTRYTYDTDHTLEQVYDPLGREGERVEYDANGRITEIIDPNGNVTMMNTDLGTRTQTITDSSGGVTTEVFDANGNVIRTISPTGAITDRTFDSLGDVLTQTTYDADGAALTTTYTYDAAGNETSMTDPNGATTRYTYNSAGQLLTTTDPLGNVSFTQYDAQGNVIQTVDPDGKTTDTTYDSNGDLTSITDPTGNITNFLSNPSGEITELIGGDSTTSLTYDADGNVTQSTQTTVDPSNPADDSSITNTKTFDANGQNTGSTDATGQSTNVYDADGHPIKSVDASGNVTLMVYNVAGQLIETTNPDGTVTREVYDSLGRVTYEADSYNPAQPAPSATHTVYDADGNVLETQQLAGVVIDIMTTPSGASSSSFVSASSVVSEVLKTYDPSGRVLSSTDQNGTTDYTYDSDGNNTEVIYGDGSKTVYTYDADGRCTSETDPDGSVTKYAYDPDGNLILQTNPDGSTTANTVSPQGQVTSTTNAAGAVTSYSYDSFGRQTEIALPAIPDPNSAGALKTPVYQFSYSGVTDIASATDPLGNTTQFTYNDDDQITSITLPGGQTESMDYNSQGTATQNVNYDGEVVIFGYDSQGRITTRTFYASQADEASNDPAYVLSYTYTAGGMVQSETDSRTGTISYTYDSSNRLTELQSPEGTINYAYDPATGNLVDTSTAFTNTHYAYTATGQLASVTMTKVNGQVLATPEVTSYTYNSSGDETGVTLPNGTSVEYGIDGLGRITEVRNLDSSGDVISDFVYTYNVAGERSGAIETVRQSDGSYQKTQLVWTYDASGQLVEEKSQDLGGNDPAANYTTIYTYDLAGNRALMVQQTGSGTTTTTYQYNQDGELTRQVSSDGTITTYGYDSNGAETSESVNGKLVEQRSYDLEGDLAQVTDYSTDAQGHNVVTVTAYTYDSSGDRVRQDTTVTPNGVAAPPQTQMFLIDPNNPSQLSQILETTNASGTPVQTFVVGDTVLGQVSSNNGLMVFETDGEGSTRQLTNAQGQVTASYSYDAYGNALGFNPATAATPILYTGGYYDAQIESYNLRSRNYDPSTGRFDRMDDFGGDPTDPRTLERYAYTENDPINHTDPSGKFIYGIDLALADLIGNIVATSVSLPEGYGALFAVGTILSPYAGLINAILFKAPVAIQMSDFAEALTKMADAVDGQEIGGLYSIYTDAVNPVLTTSGGTLTISPGASNFLQEAIASGDNYMYLSEGLTVKENTSLNFDELAEKAEEYVEEFKKDLLTTIQQIPISIALKFALAFTPGLGEVAEFPLALAEGIKDVTEFIVNIIDTAKVLSLITQTFNYSVTVDTPDDEPLYTQTSEFKVVPSLPKIVAEMITFQFDLPDDIEDATNALSSLADAIEDHSAADFKLAASDEADLLKENLGNYLNYAQVSVTRTPLIPVPQFYVKLESSHDLVTDAGFVYNDTDVLASLQSQVAAFQAIALSAGSDALENGQDLLSQISGELSNAQSQVQLFTQQQATVTADLEDLETELNDFEPYAPTSFESVESSVEALITFEQDQIQSAVNNIESDLKTLTTLVQNPPMTLAGMTSLLTGGILSALSDISTQRTQLSNALVTFQPALSALDEPLGDLVIFVQSNTGPLYTFSEEYPSFPAPLETAPGVQPPPLSPPASLSAADPRIAQLLVAAEQAWSPAVGSSWPVSVTVLVQPLPQGLLAESEVTEWSSTGKPLSATITISPDAAGQGWYVDSPSSLTSAFTQSLGGTAYAAAPGSAASGHYDLLTALEHELGHILAFNPFNPGYESHIQYENGAEYFVAPGVSAQVIAGGVLDPNIDPNDVMAASLTPGVLKFPARLELQVVSTLWGTTLPAAPATSPPPPASPTALVDHAVASLTSAAPASPVATAPVAEVAPVAKTEKTKHAKHHAVIAKPKHPAISHGRKTQTHRIVVKPHKTAATSAHHQKIPSGHLAVELSTRGKTPKGRAKP